MKNKLIPAFIGISLMLLMSSFKSFGHSLTVKPSMVSKAMPPKLSLQKVIEEQVAQKEASFKANVEAPANYTILFFASWDAGGGCSWFVAGEIKVRVSDVGNKKSKVTVISQTLVFGQVCPGLNKTVSKKMTDTELVFESTFDEELGEFTEIEFHNIDDEFFTSIKSELESTIKDVLNDREGYPEPDEE